MMSDLNQHPDVLLFRKAEEAISKRFRKRITNLDADIVLYFMDVIRGRENNEITPYDIYAMCVNNSGPTIVHSIGEYKYEMFDHTGSALVSNFKLLPATNIKFLNIDLEIQHINHAAYRYVGTGTRPYWDWIKKPSRDDLTMLLLSNEENYP